MAPDKLKKIPGFSQERYAGVVSLFHTSERVSQAPPVGPPQPRSPMHLGEIVHAVKVGFRDPPPAGLQPEMLVRVWISRTDATVRGFPSTVMKKFGASIGGRKWSRYRRRALTARTPTGTVRSLLPFPITFTFLPCQSMFASSIPTSSPTLMPVLKRVCTMAPSLAPHHTPTGQCIIIFSMSSFVNSPGLRRGTLGGFMRASGDTFMNFSSASQLR